MNIKAPYCILSGGGEGGGNFNPVSISMTSFVISNSTSEYKLHNLLFTLVVLTSKMEVQLFVPVGKVRENLIC